VLLCNDDGIRADGILALYRALAHRPGVEVVLAAPSRERSAMGHAITLGQPLFADLIQIPGCDAPCYSVSGTPADAAKLAIQALLPERPQVVISGVNYGANLGTDVIYSGTVSAAVEAAIYGIPALAVSLCVRDFHDERPPDYTYAAEFAAGLALRLAGAELPAGTILNVNVPELPAGEIKGVAVTKQGVRRYAREFVHRHDPRGRSYYWMAGTPHDGGNAPDTDVSAVQAGMVAVTPLHLDMTAHDQLTTLRDWALTP